MKTKFLKVPNDGATNIHHQNNGGLRYSVTDLRNDTIQYRTRKPRKDLSRINFVVWDHENNVEVDAH